MTDTNNPLRDMLGMNAYESSGEATPTDSYQQTALPGFRQALTARRAIRVFDENALPAETMRDCLRDTILAPSSSNLQPYELYWVRNPAKKEEVARFCLDQPAATTAGELVVVVARPDLWKSNLDTLVDMMTRHGEKPLAGPLDDYYRKITPLLRRNDPLGVNNLVRRVMLWARSRREPSVRTPVNQGDHRVWAHTQAALAAQTLMLSLAAHGYDSCPIGGLDKYRIRDLLGLPRRAEVNMVVAAGRGRPPGRLGPPLRRAENRLIKEVQ